MKNMKLIMASLTLASSSAFAMLPDMGSMPDFSMIRSYEMSVIAKDARVKSYVRQLGGKSFVVTDGKPSLEMYGVQADNGCEFDVRVVYHNWPGVDELRLSRSTNCR